MYLKDGSLYPKSNPSGQWVASQLQPYPNRAVLVRFQKFWGMVIEDDYGSSDIRIINTSVLTSPYMGITAGQGGRGLSLENVIEKPSQGRPISTVADGTHFTGVGGDIIVEGGDFTHEGDDVMNITVAWDTLTAVDSTDSFVMSGPDAIPNAGDALAFFDQALGYLGSATVQSISPPNLPPWGGQPITVQLNSPVSWLSSGIHALNMIHAPSRVFVSDVNIHDKVGRGILVGGFHMVIQNSRFENMTASAIASIMSSYFSESTGASDVAIRNNTILGTNHVAKLYQTSVDGTNYYPSRNASIAMFADLSSTYDGVWNEVTGIYPLFQDIEISGNAIQSATGTGIYVTGTRNDRIDNDHFAGCAAVPDADPIYSYFGSESRSALVLSFADNVSARSDVVIGNPICTVRKDSASSRNILVGQ
jgi:hypothetical protein